MDVRIFDITEYAQINEQYPQLKYPINKKVLGWSQKIECKAFGHGSAQKYAKEDIAQHLYLDLHVPDIDGRTTLTLELSAEQVIIPK